MIKESSESWLLGNEYVIIKIGRKKEWIRYLVILTWPANASVEERLKDKRFTFQDEQPMVLMPNGEYKPVSTSGTADYYTGNDLKTMY